MLTGARAFATAMLAILAAFLAASFFTHPIADDFDFPSSTRETGFTTAWRHQHLSWNGRYASNALGLVVPIASSSLTAYRAAVALIAAGTIAALYAWLSALAAGAFTRTETLAATLTLMALYLSQMPSLGEGIYWYTSAATYQAAIVVALLHLVCVTRYCRSGGRATLAAACVLLVAAIGFNEVLTLMLVAMYAALFVWSETPRRAVFGILLAVSIVSAAVVVFSPGNAAREATLRACHDAGRPVCDIPPIRTAPASFFVLDISANPRDWVNVAYARYFGIGQVHLTAAGAQ